MIQGSVRYKIIIIALFATTASLLFMGLSTLAVNYYGFRQNQVDDLSAQAQILGLAVMPALSFGDPNTADEYLRSLRAKEDIMAAAVYTAQGALFASYARGSFKFPELPEPDSYGYHGSELVLFKRVVENKEIIGTVYLRSRFDLGGFITFYSGALAIVIALSVLVAYIISSLLQRSITQPILDVTAVARKILDERNFDLRAQKTTNDEIGVLVAAFNDMLDEVSDRAETLEKSNQQLQHEVAEREKTQSDLAESEERNRAIVEASSQVVWIADPLGRFVQDQPSWQQYTGQTRDQFASLGWQQAVAQKDQVKLELALARALQAPAPFELPLRLWNAASQEYRSVSLRIVPLKDGNGNLQEWIGTVSDIHDLRLAEIRLRELNTELEDRIKARTAELETANKELEAFSYSVSHDLRAPIRAISGFSNLMTIDHASDLDEEANRKLAVICSEAERMNQLIDDLLAFSRVSRQVPNQTPLDMMQLARHTYDRLTNGTDHNGLKFDLARIPGANGDQHLIEQVWVNLISNAIKFSSKRCDPVVEVGAISDEKEIVYFVRDNGAGFDSRYQSKLFGVFQRLHDNADFPGTGVGLALVQRIVSRHGGRVWADSKLGEGATFHFTLPKDAAHGAD